MIKQTFRGQRLKFLVLVWLVETVDKLVSEWKKANSLDHTYIFITPMTSKITYHSFSSILFLILSASLYSLCGTFSYIRCLELKCWNEVQKNHKTCPIKNVMFWFCLYSKHWFPRNIFPMKMSTVCINKEKERIMITFVTNNSKLL